MRASIRSLSPLLLPGLLYGLCFSLAPARVQAKDDGTPQLSGALPDRGRNRPPGGRTPVLIAQVAPFNLGYDDSRGRGGGRGRSAPVVQSTGSQIIIQPVGVSYDERHNGQTVHGSMPIEVRILVGANGRIHPNADTLTIRLRTGPWVESGAANSVRDYQPSHVDYQLDLNSEHWLRDVQVNAAPGAVPATPVWQRDGEGCPKTENGSGSTVMYRMTLLWDPKHSQSNDADGPGGPLPSTTRWWANGLHTIEVRRVDGRDRTPSDLTDNLEFPTIIQPGPEFPLYQVDFPFQTMIACDTWRMDWKRFDAATLKASNLMARITQSDSEPNPGRVDEDVQVHLKAELENPEHQTILSGPTWTWTTENVEWRPHGSLPDAPFQHDTPGYSSSIQWTEGEATALHIYNFHAAGQWHIRVKAVATFTTPEGVQTLSDESYVGH